jgi:hypothetical protein
MTKPPIPPTATDAQVRALLERYLCPVPFHAVRTRILGTIASPVPKVSPLNAISALWYGKLPEFENLDAANELFNALGMSLWNRLARHQERSAPFRLIRIEVPATREGLATIAQTRLQELDSFREGLFGDNESLNLPEPAHKALGVLSEIRAMTEGTREVAQNPAKPAAPADIAIMLRQFRDITRIAEHEIHNAVLSCTRARRNMLQQPPPASPVRH